jgi:ubiquitin-protein ligase
MSLRVKRLQNEYGRLRELFGDHPRIRVTAVGGDPPDRYRVDYMIRGLERHQDGRLIVRDRHVMEITLPVEYPRMPAMCRMMSPVFHPNIDMFSVCTSDFHAAQETLSDLIVRVGQMIAFQKHNVKSPLNAEAAVWCEQNLARLPVDPADLHPVESRSGSAGASAAPIRIGRLAP